MRKNLQGNMGDSNHSNLLPQVAESDPNYLSLKTYFFGTSQYTILNISKSYKVEELIQHIIVLAEVDPQIKEYFVRGLPKQFQKNYQNPELYEMRLLEDEEDPDEPHIPLYETGPLDRERPIGVFLVKGVAFCRTKDYQEILGQSYNGIRSF